MGKPFRGTINVDIRDSVPDWAPFEPPKAPEGAPNVVYIVLDDVGFSAMSCYGGPVEAIAPDKPFFLYYAPGAAHAPHHAPREWIERYAGKFDMGYEAIREQTLARQKEMGIVPADTELAPTQPDRHAADPHRSRRPAVPAAGLHQAVGLPVRGGEAAVQPDGGGVRRVLVPRRPPHRAAA